MAQVKELSIESHERNQLIKLNDRVATFIAESGVNKVGLVLVGSKQPNTSQ